MNKDNQNIPKETNCSLKLIRTAADGKWIKQLAFFYLCKVRFVNSSIYNYRSRMHELSEEYNISTKTLYNYIDLLRSKKLVFDFHNHLSLKSIRTIKRELGDKRKTLIYVFKNDSLWFVCCKLYAKLMEYHFIKIAFNESIRRFENRNKHDTELCVGDFHPSLSIRNAAKVFNINERTARKVVSTLEFLGIIEVIKSKPRKISESKLPVNLLADFPGYLFVTDKGTFEMYGNIIVLREFPVALPRVTLKTYIKYYKSIKCKKYHNLFTVDS